MQPEMMSDPLFLATLSVWVMSKTPNNDVTLLSVLFAFNAGFSSVDSIVSGMLKNLRSEIRHRVCHYTETDWIRSIAPTDTEQDKAKRSILTALVKGVTDMQNEIPSMFCRNAFWWKIVMAISAAIALYCMATQHTERLTLLLALPIPLFMLSCRVELRAFNARFDEACKNLEKERKLIKEVDATSPKTESVVSKISANADKVKSFEESRPMPQHPQRPSAPIAPYPSHYPYGHRVSRPANGYTIHVN